MILIAAPTVAWWRSNLYQFICCSVPQYLCLHSDTGIHPMTEADLKNLKQGTGIIHLLLASHTHQPLTA